MNPLTQLPSVDRLLSDAAVASLIDIHGRAVITQLVRTALADAREAARAGSPLPDAANLIASVGAGATAQATPKLRSVFNLTGTVLHTNLGRASLPEVPARSNMTSTPADAATATTSSANCCANSPAPKPPPSSTTMPRPSSCCSTRWR